VKEKRVLSGGMKTMRGFGWFLMAICGAVKPLGGHYRIGK